MPFVKVASVDELKSGQGKTVTANGEEVALFNVNGKFFAISNICAHRGGPLGEGELEGQIVTCPLHGWQYDVETGECQTMPGSQVKHYEVKIEGKDVLVSV